MGCRKVREIIDLVDVAAAAAARAAAFLRQAQPPAPEDWTEKSRHDFVTDTDRGAEAIIAETLTQRIPGSIVVGEELSPAAARGGDVVWLVDPLDGTTNYLHGYPQYAVSIGAMVRGALGVGVIHDVTRDLVYRAAKGHGAWVERYIRQFTAVMSGSSGVRRAGSAALDLADVAAGRFDAFWELSLAPWDVAAGVVLIREAGGVVTTLAGDEDVLDGGSLVAGNPVLHRWLSELLRAA